MVEGALTQTPIYFVSEALNGSKLLYSEMEKMAYAVVMASRKLRYYFQSHKIKVPTSFPLRDMFENREASGRIGKWATKLAEHTIDFVSRSAIKSQVLADVRIVGPRGGVNWAFFKFQKQIKATLTYAMLVRLNSPTG